MDRRRTPIARWSIRATGHAGSSRAPTWRISSSSRLMTMPFCIRRRCLRAPSLLGGVSPRGRRAAESQDELAPHSITSSAATRRANKGQSLPTWRERRAPAFWWRGEVQLDRLAAGARARLDGELFGAGLEDQRRDLLGAVDADPGAEHPAARAVATRLVRCQSEALAHHASVANATRAGSGASAQSTGIRLLVAPDRVRQDARRR